MKRRLFTLAAAVSLVLCVATVGLWVRSYLSETLLFELDSGRLLIIGIDRGTASVREFRDSVTSDYFIEVLFQPQYHRASPSQYRFLGFYFAQGESSKEGAFRIIGFPFWFLSLLLAILPVTWLWGCRVANWRARVGLCPACGYDLRATPERCPECGAVPGVRNSRSPSAHV